jgi:dTDP-4-dehydrorhamnose reductase
MRVLVTGARGLLGAAIVREFERDAEVHAFERARLDVADERAVRAAADAVRPDVIINCAAFNDVDRAEEEPTAALEVNAFGAQSLGRAARAVSATLVHYSTDFVFDGEAGRPYTETDTPNPRGVYASSKLLGDWFALEAPGAYVLRVESLFGHPGRGGSRRGSLGTILDRIRAGDDVPVFVDRTVSPSYTADVASATRAILERRPEPGLYHCVNDGAATWAEIAEEIARATGQPLRVRPITLASAALRAPRPRYCALSPAKLRAAGIVMPPWKDALARYLRENGDTQRFAKSGHRNGP